uniref:Integrator complex subunit 12 n=1 Tax=Strigamia maritima TaxID=126957 RepID=T1JLY1_STRMM
MTAAQAFDLDPLFVRGLRLLHSKAKDSTEQLKQMLDDVLQQKLSGFAPLPKPINSNIPIKTLESNIKAMSFVKKPSPKHLVEVDFLSMKKSSDIKIKSEKRSHEKESPDSPHEAKKARFESPKASPPQLKIDLKKEEPDEPISAFSNSDAEDFVMGLGLACVVCRSIDVTSGNQLVECQECHNLYHQECQKPPITDQDVNDPRLVWYCTKCAKTIKKLTTKTQKSGKMSPATTPKEIVINKPLKTETPPPQPVPQLFKRSEVKPPTIAATPNTRSTNPGNKPTGLAGFAASFAGKGLSGKTTPPVGSSKNSSLNLNAKLPSLSKGSSSTPAAMKRDLVFTNLSNSIKTGGNNGASSSRTASNPPKLTPISSANGSGGKSTTPALSADKRLQIMKKKAEKKYNEKRYK